MKRLGIFVFYDRDRIVDDYVVYLLEKMQDCWNDLVIVSNGFLPEQEAGKLLKFTNHLIMRANTGLDGGAMQDFFLHQDVVTLDDYDEIFWFNDTCYGPFYPMKDVFEKMEAMENIDYWGLIDQFDTEVMEGINPGPEEWFQTFFVAVRHRMFMDEHFMEFWRNLQVDSTYESVVGNYEIPFVKYFEKFGYRHTVYCNYRKWIKEHENGMNYTVFYPYELLTQYDFPLLKRKCFTHTLEMHLSKNDGNHILMCLDYIKDFTDYPVEYIYKNIKRLYRQSKLDHMLGFEYIIDPHVKKPHTASFRIYAYIGSRYEAACLASHLKAMHLNLSKITVITTDEDQKKELEHLNGSEIITAPKMSFMEFFSLVSDLSASRTDEFSGIIYHKDSESALVNTDGVRYRNTYWNLMQQGAHIDGVLDIFNTQPWMGMLAAPKHTYSLYGLKVVNPNLTKRVIEYCERFGSIKPHKDDELDYFERFDPSMWIRTDLLGKIGKRLKETEPVKPYIFELSLYYIVQSFGYFTGTVLHEAFAKREIINNRFFHNVTVPQTILDLEDERIKNNYKKRSDAYSGKFICHAKAQRDKEISDEARFYEDVPGPEQEVIDFLMESGVKVIPIFLKHHDTPYVSSVLEHVEKGILPVGTPQYDEWENSVKREFFDDLYTDEYAKKILHTFYDSVINDGVRRLKDVEGPYYNAKNGERVTLYQPSEYDRTVYFFGPCSILGLYAEDKNTIESQLQKKLNERGERTRVVNCGMLAFNREKVIRLCSTKLKKGDIVILHDPTCRLRGNTSIDMVKAMEERNVPLSWYWDAIEHVNHHVYSIYADEVLKAIDRIDSECKSSQVQPAGNTGSEYVDAAKLLKTMRVFRTRYYVSQYFDEKFLSGKTGAIYMNCNPFTYGHRHLIEYAASRVDNLIIFVVEEDAALFSFKQRMAMVKEGTKDLPNVHVIPSGLFVASKESFPTYFTKVIDGDCGDECETDVTIFSDAIAPDFNITVRFAGEEPLDPVTHRYNEALRKVLTEHGIEFVEIPRFMDDEGDKAISASSVRHALKSGNYEAARRLCPVIDVITNMQ
ncbi:MAG: rhamnan synthesis F family protein [Eubacteriales bacterium]|nr:rhamnan synthesis F family protein [Eubacteriales bacterium]